MEHLEQLLSRPKLQNPPDIPPAARHLPIDCSKPTKEEIRNATRQLKNGKAAGPDNIPSGALKANIEPTVEMLQPLFKKIWEVLYIREEGLSPNQYPKERCPYLLFKLPGNHAPVHPRGGVQ